MGEFDWGYDVNVNGKVSSGPRQVDGGRERGGGRQEGRNEGKGMSCYENDSHEDTGARWPTFCRLF